MCPPANRIVAAMKDNRPVRRDFLSGAIVERDQVVRSLTDCDAIEAQVIAAASKTIDALKRLLNAHEPLKAFAKLKFDQSGFHPTENRSLNLIEQINQTFTYLASVRAARWLLERHPDVDVLRLNLGTSAGSDIEALDGSVAAETFAAVTPRNNNKLNADIEKVSKTGAAHKYVFYICPSHPITDPSQIRSDATVKVISLGW